jgi:hypothetical protein
LARTRENTLRKRRIRSGYGEILDLGKNRRESLEREENPVRTIFLWGKGGGIPQEIIKNARGKP